MVKTLLKKTRGEKVLPIFISIFFLLFYVYFQTASIYGGDAGDLVTAAYVKGIAHPPGYPLYTFLGWLLAKLPYSTVAWRVTLLSSIPSALALGLFFLVVNKLTRGIGSSLISTLSLGFSYLYWLYASVPEVFALHTLLVITIFYLLLNYLDTRKTVWLQGASFTFGLSLAHHHLIFFLLPAFVYLVRPKFKIAQKKGALLIKCGLYAIAGLLPYIYVVQTALSNPIITWENPATLSGFVRLVTRAMYGSFVATQGFTFQQPQDRLVALKIAADTTIVDLTWAGIILAIVGSINHLRKNRHYFFTIALAFIISGPLFVFYAAFPITLNFYLATTERFFIIPYLFLFMWMVFGIDAITDWIGRHVPVRESWGKLAIRAVFLLFPLVMFTSSLVKIAPLKQDRTVERFAQDVLKSAPDDAILLLVEDTSVFNTEYVYYTMGGKTNWRNIKLIKSGFLNADYYQKALQKEFPELDFTGMSDNQERGIITLIVDKYLNKYPIISDRVLSINKDYGWLPQGLLFRAYKNNGESVMDKQAYQELVEPLFAEYQDPLTGALHSYLNLMPSDVLRFYSRAHREASKEYLAVEEWQLADKHLKTSLLLEPQAFEAELLLGVILGKQQKCNQAETILLQYIAHMYSDPNGYRELSFIYRDCFKNETKAVEYEELYQEKLNQAQTELNAY